MNAPSLRLNRYDALLVDDILMQVVHREANGITLRPSEGGPTRHYTNRALLDLYHDRRLRICRNTEFWLSRAQAESSWREQPQRALDAFPIAWQKEALRRLEYVAACDYFFRKFKGNPKFSKRPETGYQRVARCVARYRVERSKTDPKADVRSLFDLELVSGSTLRNWKRAYVAGGCDIVALVPHHSRKSSRRIPKEFRQIVDTVMRDRWLTLERPPVTVAYDEICRLVDELKEREPRLTGKPPPSLMAAHRWIKENVGQFERTWRRQGAKTALAKLRGVKASPNLGIPLRVIEIDHTLLDVMVVSERDQKKVQRRPWLTAAIDVETRMIFGYHLDFDPPSSASIMKALRMGMMPKDLSDIPHSSPWPVEGIPEIIKLDNGREFHSISLKTAAAQLRIELRYAPPGAPYLKGRIERWFGSVARDFCAMINGRTFANVIERGEKQDSRATRTLDELRTDFKVWVVDIYHNQPHMGLMGETPLSRWNNLAGIGVRLPPRAEDLNAFLSLVVPRPLTRKGVTYRDITWYSSEVDALRLGPRRSRHDVSVKIDPDDLSRVYVLDEDKGQWLEAKCTHPYARLIEGLTLRLWDKIRDRASRESPSEKQHRLKALRAAREYILARTPKNAIHAPPSPREIAEWERNPEPSVRRQTKTSNSAIGQPQTSQVAPAQRASQQQQPTPSGSPLKAAGGRKRKPVMD